MELASQTSTLRPTAAPAALAMKTTHLASELAPMPWTALGMVWMFAETSTLDVIALVETLGLELRVRFAIPSTT